MTTVGFLLLPDFALMCYTCVIEPLRAANRLTGQRLYDWRHITPGDLPAAASNGVTIASDLPLDALAPALDLIFVCASGNPTLFDDRRCFAWLRRQARQGAVIGGVSGGPFILAKAGLLDGRRCTLHWDHMPAFREAFPAINIEPSLFVIDGSRITCSGGIAGLDMMVALIGRDHGKDLAAKVGDWFLHTHVREGVGPQRMDLRLRSGVSDDTVLTVLALMEAHLEHPLSRDDLAERAGISLRQLERLFERHLGTGVHQHYLSLRLDRARQLLRETAMSVLDVALATGFGSASHFARACRRTYGRAPSALRRTP